MRSPDDDDDDDNEESSDDNVWSTASNSRGVAAKKEGGCVFEVVQAAVISAWEPQEIKNQGTRRTALANGNIGGTYCATFLLNDIVWDISEERDCL